jgi:hypothetical protein
MNKNKISSSEAATLIMTHELNRRQFIETASYTAIGLAVASAPLPAILSLISTKCSPVL